MRRVGNIDDFVRLSRIGDDGLETQLSRHARVIDGDTLKIRSAVVSYGHLGVDFETVDGQSITGRNRISLDISNGTSRERVFIWNGGSVQFISSKSAEDLARHRAQVRQEKKKGVLVQGKMPFEAIIGARGQEREFEEGGYTPAWDALLVANLRQFYVGNPVVANLPSPKDRISFDGEDFLVQEIRKEVAVCTLRLSYDRGKKVNK